jgi:HEAT repeat protein
LKDKDLAIRIQAASILSSMGPDAKGAVADLVDALKDEAISHIALRALRAIGPDAALAVPALIEVLQSDARPYVHLEAVLTLSNCGRQAQEAVPQLLKMIKTAERDHRPAIACALAKIGPTERELPAILDLIREAKSEGEHSALPNNLSDALTELGPDVCPSVAKLLKEKEPAVRRLTVDLLSGVPPARSAESWR